MINSYIFNEHIYGVHTNHGILREYKIIPSAFTSTQVLVPALLITLHIFHLLSNLHCLWKTSLDMTGPFKVRCTSSWWLKPNSKLLETWYRHIKSHVFSNL